MTQAKNDSLRAGRYGTSTPSAVLYRSAFFRYRYLIRILPPARTGIGARPAYSNPQSFDSPARLEKRLDLGSATRNATPQAPCTELHGRYRRPKELRRNAKNPGKTRVFERRGQEPNFWVYSRCFWTVRKAVAVKSQTGRQIVCLVAGE